MIRLALLLALAFAGPAAADEAAAQRAAEMLERAEALLSAARSPEERLAALGRAAQAREAALASLRDDLRAGAGRRAEIDAALRAEERRLLAVLSALQRLERAPRAATLAHPGGPVAAARAEMSLAAFAPELAREAAALAGTLKEIAAIDEAREAAAESARAALAALQRTRGDLAAAMREGAGAAPDPTLAERLKGEAAALAAGAETLRALARSLPPSGLADRPRAASFAAARSLPPPAEGPLRRRFGAPGAGGPAEGVEVATAPWAAVYAPWPSAVRFAGPFGAEGAVVILEPDPDMLIVLSGLSGVSVAAGDIVPAGAPVGAMGGPAPAAEEFLIAAMSAVETLPAETLYMEVRRSGAPADPAIWFAFDNEEGERP
ncbi:MAG: murein hydrolase activator EnvC family protein [Pikeienuella sp.]|uniref:murein hydrolase activator EnvC family protein n=1 Tax=Pikeienuella sp. TaxID=2831957 RepID=UPI003919C3B9